MVNYTFALLLLPILFVHFVRTENLTLSGNIQNINLLEEILLKTNNHTENLVTLINACPARCSCSLKQAILEVNCSGRNFTTIPIPGNYFKSSFRQPVALILAENEILELTSKIFQNFSRVEIIVGCLNGMENVNVEAFSGLSALREVDLSDNNIEYIHPDTFKDNLNMEIINLSGNVFLKVSVSMSLLNAPHLKKLNLSYCKLSSLSELTFSNLKNITHLDVSSNDLTSLSLETLSQMEYLVDADLSNNRWTCDCTMQNVFEVISQRKNGNESHKPIRCYNDNGKTRKRRSTSKSKNYCKNETHPNTNFKIAPESVIEFEDVNIPTASINVEEDQGSSGKEQEIEVIMEINSEIPVKVSGNGEEAMVFGGLIFVLQQHLDSVYAILIVIVIFAIIILFAILLIKRVLRNHAWNLDQSNNNRKHNLTLSYGDGVRDKRSSFSPLLESTSPTDRGLTTPVEEHGRDQPPSLYYEYINSAT